MCNFIHEEGPIRIMSPFYKTNIGTEITENIDNFFSNFEAISTCAK